MIQTTLPHTHRDTDSQPHSQAPPTMAKPLFTVAYLTAGTCQVPGTVLGAWDTVVMEPYWRSWGERNIELAPPSSPLRKLFRLCPCMEMRVTANVSDHVTHSPESLHLTRGDQPHVQGLSEQYKDKQSGKIFVKFLLKDAVPISFFPLRLRA